jgi:hypothetical protein
LNTKKEGDANEGDRCKKQLQRMVTGDSCNRQLQVMVARDGWEITCPLSTVAIVTHKTHTKIAYSIHLNDAQNDQVNQRYHHQHYQETDKMKQDIVEIVMLHP